jgi:hypothetical protein
MQKAIKAQPAALFSVPRSYFTLHGLRRAQALVRSLVLPAPRHFLECLKEIDELSLIERPEDPGLTGSNKASAIGDKAIHGVCDALMFMLAGINAVISGKASHVLGAGHGRTA